MLGLEMVRLKGRLGLSLQTLLLQQRPAHPRQQESESRQLGKGHSSPELSWMGSEPAPGQSGTGRAPCSFPAPSQASLLCQGVLLPSPTTFSKQVSLLH